MSTSNYSNTILHSNESSIQLEYVSTHTRSGKTVLQYKEGDLHCRLCDMSFGQDKTLHLTHFNVHRKESILLHKERGIEKPDDDDDDEYYDDDDDEVVQESTGLVRLYEFGKFKLTCRPGRITSSLSMQLQHCSSNSLTITDVFLFNDATTLSVIEVPITLTLGEKIDFLLIGAALHANKMNDYVLRYLELPLGAELIEVHRLKRCCYSNGSLMSKQMKEYRSDSAKMRSIVENQKGKAVVPCSLNPSNYVQTLKQFIELEEYASELELTSFNCEITLTKLTLKSLSMSNTFSISIPNVQIKFPKLNKMDQFYLCPKGDGNSRYNVHATVTDILSNEIHIRVRKMQPIVDKTYKLEFILNRSQIKATHDAIETMHTFNLIGLMFPAPLPPLRADCFQIETLQWYNENIKNNNEQHLAVLSIVNGVSYPAPYLIFGPPGTGKTATVTEAICQLLRTQPNSRILVTATSNAAADELTLRLLKYLHTACYFHHNVYRLYAANVLREVTDPQLLANSNYQLHSLPEWKILSKYRVLICTITTSGRLNLLPPLQSNTHFTHLFVDECGSATEAAVLIPIAVCSQMGKINVHVILSGDPKQLGPFIVSKTAEKMGFGESLMARLMNRDTYKRDPFSKTYCDRMLTQLVRNFRSHPYIINISNEIFYNNELMAYAPKEIWNRCLGWSMLPVKNVPIVFDVTVGIAKKEGNSTSWFNTKEVKKVIKYVNILLKNKINGKHITEDDIGIISPYTRQCQKIKSILRQCGHDIMTSSVELFQGKEKPVIIVSTVRTGHQEIGFLDSPQRLNVLLTRAQSLMILIGDPNVLQKDRNWYDVLKHLSKLNVIIGSEFVLSAIRPPAAIEDEHTSILPIPIAPIRQVPYPTAPLRPVPNPIFPIQPFPVSTVLTRPVPNSTVQNRPVPNPIRQFPNSIVPIQPVPVSTIRTRPVPIQPVRTRPVPIQPVPVSTVRTRPDPIQPDRIHSVRRIATSTVVSSRHVDKPVPKRNAASKNGCCSIL